MILPFFLDANVVFANILHSEHDIRKRLTEDFMKSVEEKDAKCFISKSVEDEVEDMINKKIDRMYEILRRMQKRKNVKQTMNAFLLLEDIFTRLRERMRSETKELDFIEMKCVEEVKSKKVDVAQISSFVFDKVRKAKMGVESRISLLENKLNYVDISGTTYESLFKKYLPKGDSKHLGAVYEYGKRHGKDVVFVSFDDHFLSKRRKIEKKNKGIYIAAPFYVFERFT